MVTDEQLISMEKTLKNMERMLDDYRAELEAIEAISNAFKTTCEVLQNRLSIYEELAKKTKELIKEDDTIKLKRLYSGIKL